jgi:hypothetical protein
MAPVNAGPILLLALIAAAPTPPKTRNAPARSSGSVTGSLRYKGCPSAPGNATVSVIGRDATARTDVEGRFALSLPPGTYSLVMGGPGLVADQRVDDVLVTAGQTHDLGTVEVWPEERPAGCAGGPTPLPVAEAVVATAPDTPALDLPGASVAPAAVAAEQVWVRGSGGAAPGQFGLQGNPARDEEDALGPPTFAVGPQGSLWVFDSLNGRVQRFDVHGRQVSSFTVRRHAEEPIVEADLAVAEDGHVFLFTENDQASLTEHDASGRILVGGALPPSFKGVDQLFAGRLRPVFLMQNGQAVRAELGWGGVRAEGPLPGVPAGDLFVQAARVDRWRAVVKLSTRDGRVRRSVQLHSRVPMTGVRLVGIDRRGEIVLAVDRSEAGDEGTPQSEVLLLAIDPHGHLAGAVAVPPGGRRYEFREFALAPDGAVVQMQSDAAEVRFVRWTLKPVPREGLAGEGLVRGRVVDASRSGASVLVARLHRSVPVGADGTFEVRLPAGTWLMSFRRGAAAGVEAAAVDLRVAVAPGAMVDLGTVSFAPRPKPAAPSGAGILASPAPASSAEPFNLFSNPFLAPRAEGDARATGEPPAR